ncbi:MAG: hypothetical protein WD101_05380 [Gemmatimonadota bacterium]
MHVLLTDRLTCPRCGPEFGLILLADRMEDRRVIDGTFGCPNCRDQLEVQDGFADLRAPPRGPLPAGHAGRTEPRPDDAADAERLIALVGVAQGPGTLVLAGEPARHAAAFAATIEGIHVVAIDADLTGWPGVTGVSRMAAAPGIPLFSRSIRGVAVDARLGPAALHDAARVVAPRARVVAVRADEAATGEIFREAGLEVMASEAGTVVAARP